MTSANDGPFYDGRYLLGYNGEIYNADELSEELRANGLASDASCDTAVLFRYLVYAGVEKAVRRLRGMFAFAFADVRESTVYLCRDRFGTKPLFYRANDRGLYWASEIKALSRLVEVRPCLTQLLVFGELSEHGLTSGSTLFAGVETVPPGSYVVWRPGRSPRAVVFHDFAKEVTPEQSARLARMPDGEAVECLETLLAESSARMATLSDAPVAALVSGGIDSALVSAFAIRANPQVQLFSADVVAGVSEIQRAREVARIHRKHLHETRATLDSQLEEWAALTYHCESPIIYHPNTFALNAVCTGIASSGARVVLSGEGADELFLGYPSLVAGFASRFLFGSRANPGGSTIWHAIASARLSAQHGNDDNFEKLRFLPARDRPSTLRVIELLQSHLRTLLQRNDRVGMRHSLEMRFPFLYEPLVAFALNLSRDQRSRLSLRMHDIRHPFCTDKWLLRLLGLRMFPRRLAFRPKWGFRYDVAHRLRFSSEFFAGGFIEQSLKISCRQLGSSACGVPPETAAALVSIEIFGRIFAFDEEPEQVTDRLLRCAAVSI